MSTIIKGGTVVSGQGKRQLDIRIEGEKITELGVHLDTGGSKVIDAEGCYVFPGFIDAHTHLELNNGVTDTSDNFTTGSIAAAAKGTTTVIDMATPERGGTLADCLKTWHEMADGKSSCDYNFHMSLIEWNSALQQEIPQMIKAGVTSFKMYMAYANLRTSDAELYEAMKSIKQVNGMLGVHCENGDIADCLQRDFLKAGKTEPKYHPLSRPSEVEAEAVNRYLMIAKEVGLAVNIVHLSAQESLEVVRKARADGQKVYVETCPQYLLLTDERYDLPDFEGAKYVCAPPLRKAADKAALWEGLTDGSVNTISTDHCDFNFETQKILGKDDFTKIPGGLPGVENRPELVYTAGVAGERITVERFVQLLSEDIAKQFDLFPQKGVIQVGSDADIVIWNPDEKGVISAETQLQNVDYSAYEGFETVGKAKMVFLRGEKVAEDGQLISGQKGKYVFRTPTDKK